jgi:hypothetical protein
MCHSSAKFSNRFSGCVLRDDDDDEDWFILSLEENTIA